MELSVIFVIAVALGFDYVNGFHDAANSIATVVSTRVLSPRIAVMWAAFFNFAAFLVFGDAVAATIANDVVTQDVLSIGMILAGLVGAIIWNLITFYLGLPTSSSHALVGGMAGAAVAKAGFDVLIAEGLRKIGIFIVLSPLIGLAMGLIITLAIFWVFHRNRNIERLNRGFRTGQLISAAAISSTTAWAAVLPLPVPSTEPPRSFTTTRAPRRASSSACERPRPPPAPVMIATLPSNPRSAMKPRLEGCPRPLRIGRHPPGHRLWQGFRCAGASGRRATIRARAPRRRRRRWPRPRRSRSTPG